MSYTRYTGIHRPFPITIDDHNKPVQTNGNKHARCRRHRHRHRRRHHHHKRSAGRATPTANFWESVVGWDRQEASKAKEGQRIKRTL